MTLDIFPGKPKNKGTLLDALARMGDGAGLHEAGGDTMSLSTPIASTQDGPRMTGFAGKKAAPFVKGGGRSKTHSNDAKGRKRKAAKAALAKAKGGDYSNIDLAFNPREKRDRSGKWASGGPGWTPEKGPRGPAEAKYLDAKNMLAKAVLAQDDKIIKKYHGKVAKARIKFEAERAKDQPRSVARPRPSAIGSEEFLAKVGKRVDRMRAANPPKGSSRIGRAFRP